MPVEECKSAEISRHGGAGGGRPCPRLFVGGLHRSVKEGEILRLFLPYGRIVKEDFCWHTAGPRKGEPRGYAFVEFETTAEAGKAIAAMDGKELRGRRLQVRYVREQEFQPTDPRDFVATRKAKAAKASARPSSDPGVAPSSSRGGKGRRSREEAGGVSAEESTLDARIRALKAMIQQQPTKG